MKERIGSNADAQAQREPFITLDDLVQKAEELFTGLRTLSDRKHPLEVRRGVRKGVDDMADQDERSKTVKAGSKTSSFDLLQY